MFGMTSETANLKAAGRTKYKVPPPITGRQSMPTYQQPVQQTQATPAFQFPPRPSNPAPEQQQTPSDQFARWKKMQEARVAPQPVRPPPTAFAGSAGPTDDFDPLARADRPPASVAMKPPAGLKPLTSASLQPRHSEQSLGTPESTSALQSKVQHLENVVQQFQVDFNRLKESISKYEMILNALQAQITDGRQVETAITKIDDNVRRNLQTLGEASYTCVGRLVNNTEVYSETSLTSEVLHELAEGSLVVLHYPQIETPTGVWMQYRLVGENGSVVNGYIPLWASANSADADDRVVFVANFNSLDVVLNALMAS